MNEQELGPVSKTREQLQEILTDELSKILGNNVTTDALRKPREMTWNDVIANVHLFERLGTAYEAIKTLKGYKGDPRGFVIVEKQG